jgi:DNA-directed RNA polymerase subunit RPC12/RpoP
MDALIGVPVETVVFSGGLSRLLASVEESLRVGRSVSCPRCGLVHHTIIFNAGAELPCSRCGYSLVVPISSSKNFDIPPFAASEL